MGFERGLLRGKAASPPPPPKSLTPPLPQPPIRLGGSPLCGHFMLVCKAMIKLEPAMFYFQFYAYSQGTTGSAQLFHTGTREIEGMPSHNSLSEVSVLLLIAAQGSVSHLFGCCFFRQIKWQHISTGKSSVFTAFQNVPGHW